jgi:uncharacterized membrane protein YkvI
MNKSLKIALSVVGTVIGAGFATGKELLLFFGGAHIWGIIMLVLSVTVMCVASAAYFNILKTDAAQDSLKKFRRCKLIFPLFAAGSYSVMLACGGQALYDTFSLDFRIGILITCALTILSAKFGIEGIYRLNLIATPLIIISLILISFAGLASPVFLNYAGPVKNMLLYAGYNILSVLPLIAGVARNTGEKTGIRGIFTGFGFVLVLSLLLKILLNAYYGIAAATDIPILKIVSLLNPYFTYIYSAALYSAVLTTAASCLYSLSEKINIFAAALPLMLLSTLGFGPLIEKIYTYFGYAGTIIIFIILINSKGKFENGQKFYPKHNTGKPGKAFGFGGK